MPSVKATEKAEATIAKVRAALEAAHFPIALPTGYSPDDERVLHDGAPGYRVDFSRYFGWPHEREALVYVDWEGLGREAMLRAIEGVLARAGFGTARKHKPVQQPRQVVVILSEPGDAAT
jgi:hypothetical protein